LDSAAVLFAKTALTLASGPGLADFLDALLYLVPQLLRYDAQGLVLVDNPL
jgi:hypothetical protein